MKFSFPFRNVLTYRKTLENLAQRDFQEAFSGLQEQIKILENMREEIVQARENAYQSQIAGGTAGPALSQVDEFLKGQDIRIDRQQAKIQEIEKRVEDLREILRQKAIDYKIIDKLREQKQKKFAHDQNKLEQKKLDDLNVMRFRRSKEDPDNAKE